MFALISRHFQATHHWVTIMAFRRGLVSISVFEARDLNPVEGEKREPIGPDGIYAVPYPLRYGTASLKGVQSKFLLPNFASNIAKAFAIRLEDHQFDSGRAMTAVRLTPSLPDEQLRHLGRNVFEKTGCIANEIAFGLPVERWTAASLAERRSLIVSAITRAMQMAAEREGWNTRVVDAVSAEFETEQRGLAEFQDDPRSSIALSQKLLASLALDRWTRLTAPEREAIAVAVTEALTAQGRRMRFVGIVDCGPAGDTVPVAQWKDEETELCFSLVPGGAFQPGYDEQRLSKYQTVCRRLYSTQDAGADEDTHPARYQPDAARIYGSMARCDLTAKPRTLVSPMLFASDPVIRGSAIGRLVDTRKIRVYGNGEGPNANPWFPLYVEWREVGVILQQYGWALPSSPEMEWAIGAGRGELFYWGDEPDKAILAFHSTESFSEVDGEAAFDRLLHSSFEPEFPRHWPWTNRLGLDGILAQATWCRPDQDAQSLYPIIHRGGAAACFPWQFCGEWELLLTAAELRTTLHGNLGTRSSASLRPMLRFVDG